MTKRFAKIHTKNGKHVCEHIGEHFGKKKENIGEPIGDINDGNVFRQQNAKNNNKQKTTWNTF